MAASTDKVSISNEESDGQRVGELNTDYHIAGIRIPRYRTPMAQVAMVGFIAFTTV